MIVGIVINEEETYMKIELLNMLSSEPRDLSDVATHFVVTKRTIKNWVNELNPRLLGGRIVVKHNGIYIEGVIRHITYDSLTASQRRFFILAAFLFADGAPVFQKDFLDYAAKSTITKDIEYLKKEVGVNRASDLGKERNVNSLFNFLFTIRSNEFIYLDELNFYFGNYISSQKIKVVFDKYIGGKCLDGPITLHQNYIIFKTLCNRI